MVFSRSQWLTVKGGSESYVNKVREEMESNGCQIKIGCEVNSISKSNGGYQVLDVDGSEEMYDRIILGVNAPDALKVLGAGATVEERRILGVFQYIYSNVYLHCDESLMPHNSSAWSARNFLGTTSSGVCVTSWLNILQNIESAGPLLVTLNPRVPNHVLLKWHTSHPIPSIAAAKANHDLNNIQGKRGIWFCGAYQGYGYHEDSVKVFHVHLTFLGFITKAATEGDLGFASAYIHGYISFVDHRNGLVNLVRIIMANRCERKRLYSTKRTSGYTNCLELVELHLQNILRHAWRKNSVSKARKNISECYDLSNDFFALYLDPTMTYSCGIFKAEDESLDAAQLHKLDSLINKAKVESGHHVLDIGCGWGTLAIWLVKKTGCKCTGITLSEEQLNYAKRKVKESGLETIALVEEMYDKMRLRPEFVKAYIFPGGCLPSLGWIVSAMTNASRLNIQHVENIGDHYYTTLMNWWDNFAANREKASALGFDEKFIRTWEYYLGYCAAMFKSRICIDYQIVFARPGDSKLPSYVAIA
ncbi:unnamed protein product [Miscanthus lutarioriparius]|uniref:Amine oxidase domain-containing protein n=1 Tax=Miscanthus lutarioriparius TaxID=422564 RepID=A0A811Q1W1_9POAL|nr:unnamed protein product [Miscanthus lutarioriparius]